jgi:hypothetical protein
MSKINQKNVRKIVDEGIEEWDVTQPGAGRFVQEQTDRPFNAMSAKGNPQYKKNHKQALYEIATMSMYGKDSYHEDNDTRITRMRDGIADVLTNGTDDDVHFIANLIIHARTKMNIRTMPLVMLVHFAEVLRTLNIQYLPLRRVTADVIQRADQITDLYAYALEVFGSKGKIPMAIKRGVADAFNKFNEYQFGKYNRNGAVKMTDVLRIVHPKAKDEKQGSIFEKIMKETLAVPYTWEVELSKNGQLPEEERKSKKDLWTELLESGKIGFMALMRNARNISEAGVDAKVMKKRVYDVLSDPELVAKSKQLPFRFVNAIKATQECGDNKLHQALSTALDYSVSNVPVIGENVWIIVDASGSMMGYYGKFAARSQFSSRYCWVSTAPFETASIFAAALAKGNRDATNLKVTLFSDYAKHVAINPHLPVMDISKNFIADNWGYGTNLQSALDMKKDLGFEPDTVIILSDMQVDTLSGSRTNIFDPNAIKVAMNLEAYLSTPVSEIDGWWQLAGWSERVFDFIPALRDGVSVVETLTHPYRPYPSIAR